MSSQGTHKVLIEKRLKGKPSEVPIESVTKIVQDYKRKVLAEVTPSQQYKLIQTGYKVEDLSLMTKIHFGHLAIDPLIPEKREEAVGPADEEEAIETDYHFIQFIGPVKPEWLETLKSTNIIPLTYYHNFTYLVYGKTEDVTEVSKKEFVRSIMPYSIRIKPGKDIVEKIEDEDGENEFLIYIFTPGEKVDETINIIKSLGVRFTDERLKENFYLRVKATIPYRSLARIIELPHIYAVERYQPPKDEDELANMIIATGQVPPSPSTGTHPYLDWLENMGIDGAGVTIGIVEAGGRFDETHPAFTGRTSNVTTENRSNHATMVAGQAAADYQVDVDADGFIYGFGIAPESNLLNQYTGDGTPEERCQDTVNNAGPNGENGSIQNNSWGMGTSDPMDYRGTERTYDRLVRDADPDTAGNQLLVICFSSGNSGNNGLTRPKAAKNVITTGNFENVRPSLSYIPPGSTTSCIQNDASDRNERYIQTCIDSTPGPSSIGNCGDGRIKPDIVTVGQYTASPSFNITAANWPQRFINNRLAYGGGTSAASPKTAGVCALILQWWRQRHAVNATEKTPSSALVKGMMINGAVDTGEGGSIPNMEQGWGRVNLDNIFNPDVPAIYVDQEIVLQTTSNDVEFDIEPNNTNEPIKISLVWTDVPGSNPSGTAGNPALINSLGLEVTQGINTWFGNNFAGGVSQTGGVQDAIQNACPGQIVNNVQNVFIQNPSGTYHVRISPDSITGNCLDPSNPNNLPFQQDFALVIQNAELMNTEPMDAMLCIDRTGSMQGTPIASAKAAAMQFMDLIPTGDDHKAGLVSYATPCSYPYAPPCDSDVSINDRASVDVDLAKVTQPMKDNMTDPAGPIASIIADDCTSIGAGLKKSTERIVDNGSPLHRKIIILLTDGKENRSPCVADILPLLRKEYRIHVIAYGHSINQAMVNEISSSTHAELLHAPTEEQLAEFYHQLVAIETDEEMVDSESDTLGEEDSDSHTKRFPIINSDSKARFIIGWVNPEVTLNVELVTPEGNTINPTNASSLAHVNFVKRSTHVIYSLDKPIGSNADWEGEWSVMISRESGSASGAETYTTSLLVRSSLKLILQWDKIQYFIMDLIRLKAQVVDKQYVLTGGIKMSVRAKVPLKGYSTLLSEKPKMVAPVVGKDVMVGALSVLDKLTEREWGAIYEDREEKAAVSFKSTSEDAPMESALATSWTPHIATLKKHFVPFKDGIYTYRIKVEGTTESGARYSRIRTVSKYIKLKVDDEHVEGLIQLILKYLRALWKWLFP